MLLDLTQGGWDYRSVYKLCISFVTPRPIALVSTVSSDGRPNLAPFSFYNMVSANPPTVMFCPGLRRDRTEKDTLINVKQTSQFVVATVDADLGERMVRCAAELAYGESEFEFSGLTQAAAARVRPALVREAPVNIECELWKIVETGAEPGSSSVVFGRIVAIHVRDELLTEEGVVDPHRLRAVGRLGGAWYANVTEPYAMRIPEPPASKGRG